MSSTKDISREDALTHFGVKGMRWGVRNEDDISSKPKAAAKPLPKKKKRWRPTKKQVVVAAAGAAFIAAAGYAVYNQQQAKLPIDYDAIQKRLALDDPILPINSSHKAWKLNPALAAKDITLNQLMSRVVQGINPGYPERGTTVNCRRCTLAYEMRRRGFAVMAQRVSNEMDQSRGALNEIAGLHVAPMELGEHPILPPKGGSLSRPTPVDLFRELLKQPDGSRGEVVTVWKMGGGHSIAYELFQGQPVLIDAQSGKKFHSPKEMLDHFQHLDIASLAFTRLDDKELDMERLERWVKDDNS